MVSLFYEMTAQIAGNADASRALGSGNAAQVSFDVPKNATGAYNYWVSRCERAVRVMNRRPHFVWLDIQSYFRLSDAEMESTFGPCPGDPGAVSVNAIPIALISNSQLKCLTERIRFLF